MAEKHLQALHEVFKALCFLATLLCCSLKCMGNGFFFFFFLFTVLLSPSTNPSICICDSLVQVTAKSKIKTLKKSFFLFNTKSTVLTQCVNCFFLFAPLKAHRHEVTICNYEATANPADHKVESIIPQTNFIS